jgi:hypothetical protein
MQAHSKVPLRLALGSAAFLAASAAGLHASAADGASRIISFWRVDCAPCLHELAILPTIAERHPAIAITLLVLKDDGRAAAAIERDLHPNLVLETFVGDEAALLARYGDPERALPFSVALAADGAVCARRFGILGTDIADRWAEEC